MRALPQGTRGRGAAPGLVRPAARAGRLCPPRGRRAEGFTLLEVLVAFLILTVTLVAVHQAFGTALLARQSSQELWKAMVFAEEELGRLERAREPPRVSVRQGVYPKDHRLAGYAWKQTTRNDSPFPGVTVRKITLRLEWGPKKHRRSYSAVLHLPPPQSR